MEHNNDNTAAVASIEDVADCTARADAQVRTVLQGVMAQQRSASAALDYVAALAPGVKANCWSLAESAGHEGQCRMQGLLGSYRWDWKDLRDQLPAPQSLAEKVATMASLPRWVHGVQDADVFPCGQVTVRAS